MQMSEVLDKLKSLQDVLAEKYEVEAKVEELPKSLDGTTESLDRFKAEYIETNAEYEDQKSKVTALKQDLEEAVRARENGEKEMDSVTTHREFEVLEKQVKEAGEKESVLRDNLKKEEKRLDELEERLRGEEALIETTESDVNESKNNLTRELDELKSQLTGLEAQEKEMSDGIDSEIIFKFQRIIQRNRKGIVAVKGNVCDGCHMILPAQFANEVHKGEKILFCPYCSRILFYEEVEGEESTFFSMSDDSLIADFGDESFEDDLDELDDDYSSMDSESEDSDSPDQASGFDEN